jgi:hypothetical protein
MLTITAKIETLKEKKHVGSQPKIIINFIILQKIK